MVTEAKENYCVDIRGGITGLANGYQNNKHFTCLKFLIPGFSVKIQEGTRSYCDKILKCPDKKKQKQKGGRNIQRKQ